VRKTIAPYREEVKECSIDLRVGGDYHFVFVTDDGTVTKLPHRLAFRDQAGRDHMTKFDGLEANFDNVEDLLRSLLDPEGTVSG
jgi:hypothetical protein